jgi:hypothetical protein
MTRGRSRRVCIDQLEAEDIRLASLPTCVLNLDASSVVETVVETEGSRTRAGASRLLSHRICASRPFASTELVLRGFSP